MPASEVYDRGEITCMYFVKSAVQILLVTDSASIQAAVYVY